MMDRAPTSTSTTCTPTRRRIATYAVGYQDTNGQEIAVYVEVAWFGDVSEQEARAVVAGLLPADAVRTELYVAPPTPGGETALVSYRYESASLNAAYDRILAGEILVISQERWNDANPPAGTRVRAVSLIVRTITQ
ncbi:MAG: hypothetical protein H0V24_02400 [Chloroflexia bacterium]|nr:hypothetical protein [Chloroflexia bacterium]MDQ3413150.1 hypothetical protein [Chloroflexota bacterium]